MPRRDDEARLAEVQDKIEGLYVARGDGFNLPARYRALVTLEAMLLERVKVPNERRERELVLLGG
jgi:hypothetical protein